MIKYKVMWGWVFRKGEIEKRINVFFSVFNIIFIALSSVSECGDVYACVYQVSVVLSHSLNKLNLVTSKKY